LRFSTGWEVSNYLMRAEFLDGPLEQWRNSNLDSENEEGRYVWGTDLSRADVEHVAGWVSG